MRITSALVVLYFISNVASTPIVTKLRGLEILGKGLSLPHIDKLEGNQLADDIANWTVSELTGKREIIMEDFLVKKFLGGRSCVLYSQLKVNRASFESKLQGSIPLLLEELSGVNVTGVSIGYDKEKLTLTTSVFLKYSYLVVTFITDCFILNEIQRIFGHIALYLTAKSMFLEENVVKTIIQGDYNSSNKISYSRANWQGDVNASLEDSFRKWLEITGSEQTLLQALNKPHEGPMGGSIQGFIFWKHLKPQEILQSGALKQSQTLTSFDLLIIFENEKGYLFPTKRNQNIANVPNTPVVPTPEVLTDNPVSQILAADKNANGNNTNEKSSVENALNKFEEKWNNQPNTTMTVSDFKILKGKTLGSGSYGTVVLVEHIKSKKIYAMKVLNKEAVVNKNEIQHVINEKRILYAIDFPFLVKLHYHFKDDANLYLVLDYSPGGEMFQRLTTGHFSEHDARFYIAQVILAIEYLHSVDVIYRDLKPENILFGKDGYLIITDFGLAKRLGKKGRTRFVVPTTPEYLAPEILKQSSKGDDKAVDWWAVGTILFEMVYGMPPFYVENDVQRMYKKILQNDVVYPSHFSVELKSLVSQLLHKDPQKRLGSSKEGAAAIKRHKFFSNLDWNAILLKKEKAPWKPKIKDDMDTSNFDPEHSITISTSAKKPYHDEFAQF